MALRWRKQQNETGLARITQSRRGFDLRDGDDVIMRVAMSYGTGRTELGWYWHGLGANSCAHPVPTPDEAKSQAMTFYKQAANA